MRVAFGICAAFAVCISISAQNKLNIVIAQGQLRASVEATSTEPYQIGPWAAIPAVPLTTNSHPTTHDFRIRTWTEGGQVRVVVFAVQLDEREHETETQIDSFLLAADQSKDVTQTERYGAAHVEVSAVVVPLVP
jgi:hypothetical protein